MVEDNGKKSANSVRMADLVIVGIISLLLGIVLSLPSLAQTKADRGEPAPSMSGASVEDPALDASDVSGGVAATVNGVEIGENAVTAFIESFRASQGLDDAQSWGKWLIDAGYSIDTLRNETVDYYVNCELIRQAAAKHGLSASADEVEAAVQEQVSAAGSERRWLAALEAMGSSEARARSEAELALLRQKLSEQLAEGEAAFSEYMIAFKNDADIERNPQPSGLPYAIDLAPFEEAAREEVQSAGAGDAGPTGGDAPRTEASEPDSADASADVVNG